MHGAISILLVLFIYFARKIFLKYAYLREWFDSKKYSFDFYFFILLATTCVWFVAFLNIQTSQLNTNFI